MSEELQDQQQLENPVAPEDVNLMDAMEELKRNTVPKSDYDRVMRRNKELSQAIINNSAIEQENKPKDMDTKESLIRDLYSEDRKPLSNRQYWEKTLKLRKMEIEEGQPDPFLPTDSSSKYSVENIQTAERVADGLQSILDEANGNDDMFDALFQARCEEVNMPGARNKFRSY